MFSLNLIKLEVAEKETASICVLLNEKVRERKSRKKNLC